MSEPLKPPYVEKVVDLEGIQVWVVDGMYIRDHLDEEFTNFGQHYCFPFIPENEFWIDHEKNPQERRFFIEHLLVEHRLMAAGKPYGEALEKADRAERKQRRRSSDMKKLTHNRQTLPDAMQVHERLWKKLENGLSVWIVVGRLVRSGFDIDFTAGGHDYVYEFVPENEVWIDNDIAEAERGYVLVHELHERRLMASGWPYSKAHADSSRLELRCRRHPDELHHALADEDWT